MIEGSGFLVRAINIAKGAKILLMPEMESSGQWRLANMLGILSIANIPHKNPLKDLFPSEMAGINKHDRNNSQPINIILLFNNLSMVVEPDAWAKRRCDF